MELIRDHSLMEQFFKQWQSELGNDLDRYRNHCYRVVNHCQMLKPLERAELEQVMIAACFHDIGIWLDNTFDYLKPSRDRVNNYLVRDGKNQWSAAVCAMVMEHHKVTSYKGPNAPLVDAFRKADWIDVSMGLLTFGVPRKAINEIRQAFPYLGFHTMLTRLTAKNTLRHPLKPLPMFKL